MMFISDENTGKDRNPVEKLPNFQLRLVIKKNKVTRIASCPKQETNS